MLFRIFESESPEQFYSVPRFRDQDELQGNLRRLCQAWQSYFENYIRQTTLEFHGSPKLPWEEKERALVSTFLAAISRSYKRSAIISELPVAKKGTKTSLGRCDLWAMIPELSVCSHSFSFYLEAKISLRARPVRTLEKRLTGNYGISKMFRDYEKNCGLRIRNKSPFVREKGRKHEHYSITLLMLPVRATRDDVPAIYAALHKAFSERRTLRLRERQIRRTMARYPTVALIAIPDSPHRPSMVACFTVLGGTSQFLFNRETA